MIVWGGLGSGMTYLGTGGRYDPSADAWAPISTTGAPSARYRHTSIWMGTEMLVWGGYDHRTPPYYFNTGSRYGPSTDTWAPISTVGAPSGCSGHTAVWTGTEMIVWGGDDITLGPSMAGGRYDPSTNTWALLPTIGAASARSDHTAVWTGTEMIVWGGLGAQGFLSTGGRYDPSTDTWAPISTIGALSARYEHTAVWTGVEMIVWGGYGAQGVVNTGARYDPRSDTWAPLSADAPSRRGRHTAIWSGQEMVVWGGTDRGPAFPNVVRRYRP